MFREMSEAIEEEGKQELIYHIEIIILNQQDDFKFTSQVDCLPFLREMLKVIAAR